MCSRDTSRFDSAVSLRWYSPWVAICTYSLDRSLFSGCFPAAWPLLTSPTSPGRPEMCRCGAPWASYSLWWLCLLPWRVSSQPSLSRQNVGRLTPDVLNDAENSLHYSDRITVVLLWKETLTYV